MSIGNLELFCRVGYDTDMDDLITTSEAADMIGCIPRRVRQLIAEGRLAGRRMGRDWLVQRASVEAYRDSPRQPGRPKVATPATED
jgi:excisionase family DNA binding protein